MLFICFKVFLNSCLNKIASRERAGIRRSQRNKQPSTKPIGKDAKHKAQQFLGLQRYAPISLEF